MSRPENAMPGEHRTVARVMSILEIVFTSGDQGARLGDLAEALDAPKSSVHGLAKGLVATGYLRENGGRYLAGPASAVLLAPHAPGFQAVYHQALEQLSARWNETVMLATLVGESVVHVDRVESTFLVRAATPMHVRRPLWPGSSGKCFLAFMPPEKAEDYLRRHLRRADVPSARAELEQVRSEVVGFNRGEVDPDYVGVASPVVFAGAPVTVCISIGGPKARVGERIDEMAEAVRAAARALSTVASSA